jgi:hypothetical protein
MSYIEVHPGLTKIRMLIFSVLCWRWDVNPGNDLETMQAVSSCGWQEVWIEVNAGVGGREKEEGGWVVWIW